MPKTQFYSLFLTILLFIAVNRPAHAERIALVIGNAKYKNENILRNPINDATLIAKVLRNDLKFDSVTEYANLERRELAQAFTEFSKRAKGAEAVFVYYSGHGLQEGGQNYLIPVDAKIQQESDIPIEGIAALGLLAKLEAANPKVTILVLDACRTNLYSKSNSTKGIEKGLARIGEVAEGMLVAYATRDGATADDGNGSNSPYAMALARQLKRADQPIRLAFERVADEVKKVTKERQKPVTYGDLKSSVYLTSFANIAAPVRAQSSTVEEGVWQAAVSGDSIESYEAYVAEYPSGLFLPAARIKLSTLKQQERARRKVAVTDVQQDADKLNDNHTLDGAWQGTGVQVDGQSWQFKMIIARSSSSVEYPSLGCGGNLATLESHRDNEVFLEKLTYGVSKCVIGIKVIVVKSGANVAQIQWFYPDGRLAANGNMWR